MQAEHVLILGTSGTGKGHLVAQSLIQTMQPVKKVIVLDPEDQFGEGGPLIRRGQLPEMKRPVPQAAVETILSLRKSNRLANTRIRWRFVPNGLKQAEWVMRLAMTIGDCHLVVDEAANYRRAAPRSKAERERYGVDNFLDWTIQSGRPRGVKVWAITQRPMLVSPTVRTAPACICFYSPEMEERDLGYLRGKYGNEAIEELGTLSRDSHEFLIWGRADVAVKPYFALNLNGRG